MFKDLEKRIFDKKEEIQSVKSQFKISLNKLERELNALQDELKLKCEGIQTDCIDIAKKVLTIKGLKYYGGGDTVECVNDALQDIVDGFKKLRHKYFGCKNYASFYCQRHDCQYGFSPTHGTIVFSIALNEWYRKEPEQITEEEVNACIYCLVNLSKLKKVMLAN